MDKPVLVAKAVMVDKEGRVLILTRSATSPVRPGQLDIPGGGIDAGEGPTEAVVREIDEEVGLQLQADDVKLIFSNTNFYEDKTTIRFLFFAPWPEGVEPKLSHEHSSYTWLSLAEVKQQYNHPIWVEGIEYAANHNLLPVQLS